MGDHTSTADFHKRITFAGSLIAIGIVFGDIGTSPLYTINAVFHNKIITPSIALGTLSCIFWTLFFQTTLKYVIITLQADNKGEGGIFSLYALIRRYWGKWLIIPAMIGGAFLIADGIITPPISVASAVEGLQKVIPGINTVPIVIAILVGLFLFQQFGTDKIGKVFGPVMIIWFCFIGVIGIMAATTYPGVFRALNPYYGYQLLVNEPRGFWFLGSIFLCTTGAEALYSDMGHCGRNNIRVSWIFIKIMLICAYAGQTAWLMNHAGERLGEISPFYSIIPTAIYWPSLIISTLATIIASQALISGCFTLINEAIRLNIWPRHLVLFPGKMKGQLYIPAINWFLMAACIGMVLHFKESSKMEAAFGLSVTLTMLMSTVLINFYLHAKRVNFFLVAIATGLFLTIEISFLVANLQKIKDGGWIMLLIGAGLFLIMFIWWKGSTIKNRFTRNIKLADIAGQLQSLSNDKNIPKLSTHLVYVTRSAHYKTIESAIVSSILHGMPKKADIYWFIHVNVMDEPYALQYDLHTIAENDIYVIHLNLGFRIEPRVEFYFRQIVSEMLHAKEIDLSGRFEKAYQSDNIGDVKFVLTNSFLSYANDMPFIKNFIMKAYYNLRMLSVKDHINFGIDQSNVTTEIYPLLITPVESKKIKRN
jgi:KUP system potassium uptake protein